VRADLPVPRPAYHGARWTLQSACGRGRPGATVTAGRLAPALVEPAGSRNLAGYEPLTWPPRSSRQHRLLASWLGFDRRSPRCSRSYAPHTPPRFSMVTTDGHVLHRRELLDWLAGAGNTRPGLRILISDVTVVAELDGAVLAGVPGDARGARAHQLAPGHRPAAPRAHRPALGARPGDPAAELSTDPWDTPPAEHTLPSQFSSATVYWLDCIYARCDTLVSIAAPSSRRAWRGPGSPVAPTAPDPGEISMQPPKRSAGVALLLGVGAHRRTGRGGRARRTRGKRRGHRARGRQDGRTGVARARRG